MLTRDSISSGRYLESFDSLPADLIWSEERIEQSMLQTLASEPPDSDIWIFAYGSLIWNPLLQFAERQRAMLLGWHRSFCIHITAGRARPETPGRMLAVEPGGVAQGVAFRLAPDSADQELRLMWIREMITGSYVPTWAPVTLADGRTVRAIVFTANTESSQYRADSSIYTVAPMVSAATGQHGSNADYVLRLQQSLHDFGMRDSYVSSLTDALRWCQLLPQPEHF